MANTKTTALTANTAPLLGDMLYLVDDPTGTPASQSVLLRYAHRFDVDGVMLNGVITPTVSSNNLTVTIKTLAGTNPSASDPVLVKINGTMYAITGSLSVTVNAGTNTFNAGAAEFVALTTGYFVYLSYRTASSAVVLGFARFPTATLYSHFSSTATDETYGAFSTAPAATDNVVNIGYFEATNSGTASYNWSVPTYTNNNLKHRPTFETNILTWIPQATNLTVGNGTQTAWYQLNGRMVRGYNKLAFGSTTSVSGNVQWSVPFTRDTTYYGSNATPADILRMADASPSATYQGTAQMNTTGTKHNMLAVDSSATYLTQTNVTSTIPITWTTSDTMEYTFNYLR